MILLENSVIDMEYSDFLYVSSWDNNLYTYDISTFSLKNVIENSSPILRFKKINNCLIYADASGYVNFYENDFVYKTLDTKIKGIQSLEIHNNRLIMGGWSKKLCFYDNDVYEYLDIEDKVHGSSLFENYLLLNMGTKIQVMDLRNKQILFNKRYKEINRSVLIRDKNIFLGSVGGKLIVENTENNKTYTINAHFKVDDINKMMFPVNRILYDDFLYTGGSDGNLIRWKLCDKIKNKTIFAEKEGIKNFRKIGDLFIMCCGYNYEQGYEKGNEECKIYVKPFDL